MTNYNKTKRETERDMLICRTVFFVYDHCVKCIQVCAVVGFVFWEDVCRIFYIIRLRIFYTMGYIG